jgi:hypothetical protein
MWSYLLISLGVSIATTLFLYIDSRLFDKPKTKTTYAKTIAITNILTFATIYILTWLSPTKNMGDAIQTGGVIKKITGQNTTFVQQIGEEMLAGEAPF